MYIRKYSFFEIFFPLTLLAFLGQGTCFIEITHITSARFIFLFLLLAFFLFRKKLCTFLPPIFILILSLYLFWCVSTTLWSEVPSLSLAKSIPFVAVVLVMISAGVYWVLKFGTDQSLRWMLVIVIMTLISGIFGYRGQNYEKDLIYYGGLSGNPNNFGFFTAIIIPFFIWKCYFTDRKNFLFLMWVFFLVIDLYFLMTSFCRSGMVIFLCVVCFFLLSISGSKKMICGVSTFFLIAIFLLFGPVSNIENVFVDHINKSVASDNVNNGIVFSSRQEKWERSYQQAVKGGMTGGGFAVTIGDTDFSIDHMTKDYGREKGNSQFAIVEETGIIGFIFYLAVLSLFFIYTISHWIQLKGNSRVILGLVLGAIIGIFAESFVEAWWDSLGPEVICFWSFVGVAFGIIALEKRKMQYNYNLIKRKKNEHLNH